ncbi:hypothetical protein, partial [Yoonia vestfoldensis]
MNKIVSTDFITDDVQRLVPVDATATTPKNAAVAKLMKAWEAKTTQRTAKGAGLTLMALSLAACNDDNTTAAAPTTPTTPTTPVTPAGQTFTLTTGLDTIVGGTGADSISASNTTLNAGDSVTGGAGADVLAVFSSAAATLGGFVVTGVETISASSNSATATDVLSLNLGSVTGETDLRVTGSSSSVTFTNTDNIANLTLSYNSAGNVIVAYNTSTIAGTADVQSLTTTDATNGVVTLAGIETVNIANSGVSTIATLTTAAATTVNVTGSGTLTLTDIDDVTTTLNMSAFTGTSVTGGYGAVNIAVTGGTGNDTFIVDMANITSLDTITGGTGTDTLRINDSMTTAADVAGITGIEVVELRNTGTGANDDTVDASIFATASINIRVADTNDGTNAELVTVSNAG